MRDPHLLSGWKRDTWQQQTKKKLKTTDLQPCFPNGVQQESHSVLPSSSASKFLIIRSPVSRMKSTDFSRSSQQPRSFRLRSELCGHVRLLMSVKVGHFWSAHSGVYSAPTQAFICIWSMLPNFNSKKVFSFKLQHTFDYFHMYICIKKLLSVQYVTCLKEHIYLIILYE